MKSTFVLETGERIHKGEAPRMHVGEAVVLSGGSYNVTKIIHVMSKYNHFSGELSHSITYVLQEVPE